MHRHKLDLNLLISLRVLLVEKSVTRAGEIMHVTQPAMSGILARLRDYFDDKLIVPVGRKMELTPLAQSLIEPLNNLLMQVDITLNTRPNFDSATSKRHFTILASDYSIRVLLLEVLRRVHHEATGIKIELIESFENASERLEEGEVDFIITPQNFISNKHSSFVLFEDMFCVIADKNNTQIGDTITQEEYLSFGHAMFENWLPDVQDDQRRIEVVTQTFGLLPHLVLGTERIATMHMRIARQCMDMLPIRVVQPLFDTLPIAEVLQWHNNRDTDSGSVWLRNKIIEAAHDLPQIPIFGSL